MMDRPLTPAEVRELQLACSIKEVHRYETFLVTEEMRDLCMAAAESFPSEEPFSPSEAPSLLGYMVIDQPDPVILLWRNIDGILGLSCTDSTYDRSRTVLFDSTDSAWHIPQWHPNKQSPDEGDYRFITLVRTIWALMQMPYVSTDVRRARRTSIDKRNKSKLRSHTISVIDLRRSARSTTPTPTGRHLTARHYRRGTWNWQPYGPGNSLRRKQYRRPTIVGPDGTPIIVRDKVNYFRR